MSLDRSGAPEIPAERARTYREAGLWEGRTIPEQFCQAATVNPDRVAVRTHDTALTYCELDRQSDAVAAGLLDAGIRPGEAAVLQLANTSHAIVVWYGLLKAGVIPVCALPVHRRYEIEQIAEQTGAVAHIVQADFAGFDLVALAAEIRGLLPTMRLTLTVGGDGSTGGLAVEALEQTSPSAAAADRLARVARAGDPQAVAVHQLSGGTTATPKIIPRRHEEYWYNAVATARWWDHDQSSVLAFGLPILHNAGVVNALHAAHCVGGTLLLGTPHPDVLMPLMAAHHPTFFMGPPGLMREYLQHPTFDAAFAAIGQCVLTAAPVAQSLFDELEARGVHVAQAFGMGEGLFLFTPPEASAAVRATTVGVPISAFDELRVIDVESGRPAEPGRAGELCARGPYTIAGYFNAADRNAEAFTPDGFYRSGDLVRVRDLDGLAAISLEGRVKDLINRGGEKVNAEEVESLLLQHPAVGDVALVAMPDQRLGERACVYIVTSDGHAAPALSDLCAFLAERGVAKFKWPERLEPIDVLPRTEIGKVAKAQLRRDVARKLNQTTEPDPGENA
jgi:2,3-dihydroxybenzoate-AMP ligase